MLIASSHAGPKCSEVLRHGTGEQVQLVTDLPEAARRLIQGDYKAIVLDQNLVDEDPRAAARLLLDSGAAIPVYLNLAISGPERVVSEVKAAFRRWQSERVTAMKAAGSELRDELRGAVTGILLSSELAMGMPDVPPAAKAKLAEVVDLAERMRQRLQV